MDMHAELGAGLKAVLDKHGHGFHYAVIQRCIDEHEQGRSGWTFRVAEYPFELNGQTGSIDFVLERDDGALLVAECKRVDPNLADWCFVRAPFTHGTTRLATPVISQVMYARGETQEWPTIIRGQESRTFHHAFELKTKATGNELGKTLDAAVAQIMRGVGGMLQVLAANAGDMMRKGKPLPVIPVVFTTAQLFETGVELNEAVVATGIVPKLEANPVPWLWYQMNHTSALRPKLPVVYTAEHEGLVSQLTMHHTRAVAIVSSDGIRHFLAEATNNLVLNRL